MLRANLAVEQPEKVTIKTAQSGTEQSTSTAIMLKSLTPQQRAYIRQQHDVSRLKFYYWENAQRAELNGQHYTPFQWSNNQQANKYLTHVSEGTVYDSNDKIGDGEHYHPEDLMFDFLPSLSSKFWG